MTELAVLTPSYGPDLELCRDLNRSVLEWTRDDVMHHIVVPRSDAGSFADMDGGRTRVWTVEELLPRRMRAMPFANLWVNVRRPYPPVRGWVMQQVVKLLATSRIEAEVMLPLDSDVLLVREVGVETFRRDGVVRFYRKEQAVHAGMERHLIWHEASRRLLGLPSGGPPPHSDYVGPLGAWDRRLVLDMLSRIERVTGRSWLDAIASELHFSEWTLYGVYVDQVAGARATSYHVDSMPCHSYWETTPLDLAGATAFVRECPPDDVAILIQSKSFTPVHVRRAALAALAARSPAVS